MQSIVIIGLVLMLSACQGSKLNGSIGAASSASHEREHSAEVGGGSSNSGSTPETAAGTTPASPKPNSDSSISGDSGTLITPQAALPPVAIAGASLTCSLTSSNSTLQCMTYSNAEKVDLKPSKFFIDSSASKGTQDASGWVEIAMTPIELGIYTAPAPTGIPSSFVVIMRYRPTAGTVDEHLAAQVGKDEMSYTNLVKNGNFESEFPFSGDSNDFFAASNASPNWIIGSVPDTSCSQDTFLRIQKGGSYPSLDGERWASINSKCIPAAGTLASLPSIMQNMPTRVGNSYFVSFQARIDDEILKAGAGSKITVQWGSGGQKRALTFAPTSTQWQTYHYYSTSDNPLVKLFFIGNNEGSRSPVMVDNIKVYDLGPKPL